MPEFKSQMRKGRKYGSNRQPEANSGAIKTVGQSDVKAKRPKDSGTPKAPQIPKSVRSFFAVEIVQVLTAHNPAFRRADNPFVAIRIMAGLADGIIRDDIEDKILG